MLFWKIAFSKNIITKISTLAKRPPAYTAEIKLSQCLIVEGLPNQVKDQKLPYRWLNQNGGTMWPTSYGHDDKQ